MQIVQVRISETGGNPWKIDIDNLSREDATLKEKTMAYIIEGVLKEHFERMSKPGTFKSVEIK